MKLTFLLGLVVLINSQVTMADTDIIYGDDNRLEAYESPEIIKLLGKSTAMMVESKKLVDLSSHIMMPPSSVKEDNKLCDGERFEHQLSVGKCSGFLVGQDLLVTAGHCITSEYDCTTNSWVFDYVVNEDSGRANVVVPKSSVYSCKRVVDAKFVMTQTMKLDYALIQLDRVVAGREPLKVRISRKIEDQSDIFVIGYPSGLPQKFAGDASVVENEDPFFFKANLDTYGGNSGSAVFNAGTYEVEGVLVRGAKDYIIDEVKRCRISNQVPMQAAGVASFGESATRITMIPSLKYRQDLMNAAKNGDLETVKRLEALGVDLEITDNDYNSALDYAVMGGHNKVADYIKSKKNSRFLRLPAIFEDGQKAKSSVTYSQREGVINAWHFKI